MTTFELDTQKLEKEDFQNRIGNRIRQLRESKNMTQVELAHLCNFEKSNMNRIEAGNTSTNTFTLYKICSALEISMRDFFTFEL
jgi:transcriptional regulator with XRE-family HTH domain